MKNGPHSGNVKKLQAQIAELKEALDGRAFYIPEFTANKLKADGIEEMLSNCHHKQGVSRDWITAYIAQLRGE